MSDLTPDSEKPRRVVTWRALLAGSICAIIIAVATPYGTLKIKSATMALDFSVPAAVFTMFILALVVNLYRLATGRTLLNRGEMLVAYSMMAVACAICTMGLTAYIVPMVGTPHYYASPENKWAEYLVPQTPEWLMLSKDGTGGKAIEYLFEGLPNKISRKEVAAIYAAWIPPLLWWGIFLAALYAVSICLMAILRKQWVERERIVYPLVQLPMELAGEPQAADERVCPFFKNRLLWIGFAIPFLICTLTAMRGHFDFMATVRPRLVWRARLLDEQWALHIRLSWQTIGLAYLLSTDVALCVWFFGLAGSFYGGLSKFLGFQSVEKLGIYGAAPWPDLGHFGMGAMIALVLLRMWIARAHLIGVIRKGLRRKTDVDDGGEPMSYFWAFWGVVVGAIVMTVWLCASGLPLYVTLLVLFAAFVGFIGLTRIIAESGMPVSIVPMISSDFIVSAIGTSAIGKQGLAAMPWTYVWNGDVRTFVMCSAAHGMRACAERRRSYRGVFFAMMLAVGVAVVASVYITLRLAYNEGGVNLAGWFFVRGPQCPFEMASDLIRGEPRLPNMRGWIATSIGATAMVFITLARHRFIWWPLNPVGLPISVVVWTQYLWFSVFLAWLIKVHVLKYGGPKFYLKLRPFFLGLVLGQYAGAAFWLVIDGLTGVTANRTFWI